MTTPRPDACRFVYRNEDGDYLCGAIESIHGEGLGRIGDHAYVATTPRPDDVLLLDDPWYGRIVIRDIGTGYQRALGSGPCEWAQWPLDRPLTEDAFFPEASGAFRDALYRVTGNPR